MKNILAFVLLFVCALVSFGQSPTLTSNLGLSQIPEGYKNWGILYNNDQLTIDTVFGGGKAIPWGITSTGPVRFRSTPGGVSTVSIDPSTGAIVQQGSSSLTFTMKNLSAIAASWLLDTSSATTAIQSMLPGVSPDGNSGVSVLGSVTALNGFVAPNVSTLVSPVAGDISAPLNAAIAACTTNCSFFLNASGAVNVNLPIVVNKPNVSIACENPAATVLQGVTYPLINNVTMGISSNILTVTTATPHKYSVGELIFFNSSVLGTAKNVYVMSTPTPTSFTAYYSHADVPVQSDTRTSTPISNLIVASADNFELSHCGFNKYKTSNNAPVVQVSATATSTANGAKIHDNVLWTSYPNPTSFGTTPMAAWHASTTVPTGYKLLVGVGNQDTKYLMTATTGGTTDAVAPAQVITALGPNSTCTQAPHVQLALSGGAVSSATVTAAGAGCGASGASVAFTVIGGNGTGAVLTPTWNSDGTLASVAVTNGGSGYTATWDFTIGHTTTDGTVVWTNQQTVTTDGAIGIRIVGWDATHTANNAQIYRNQVSFPFIDVAVATFASYADIYDNTLYLGENIDINGDEGMVTGTHVHHNWIIDSTAGSWVQDGDHTVVEHNQFLNYGLNGAPAINYSNPFLGGIDTANIDRGNQYVGSAISGAAVAAVQSQNDLTIDGDHISYAGLNGIKIGGPSSGGAGAENTHIKNVIVKDNGQAAPNSGLFCGVYLSVATTSAPWFYGDITNSSIYDDQKSYAGPLAQYTTQPYAICSNSTGTGAPKFFKALNNYMPVTAWSTASGNGTSYNFPLGCTSCVLNPSILPVLGAGAAAVTGPSVTTPGNLAQYADAIGTLGTGVAPSTTVNGQPCPLGGSCTVGSSSDVMGTPSTPIYPAGVSANPNSVTPLQYDISRYGRATAETMPNLAKLIGGWFLSATPTTQPIILGAGDSRGVGATLPDASTQSFVSRFTADLNAGVQGLGGQGPVFQAVNIAVNGSVANQFPAALIAYQQYAPYSVSIHTAGTGYALGDVFSLNQNSTANSALWKVTAVSAGVPTAIAPTPYVDCITLSDTSAPSTGLYAVGTNVPTTNNNGGCAIAVQNGTGTGLTVDINSVGWPNPVVTLFKYGTNSSGALTFNSGGNFQGEQKAVKANILAAKALGSDVVILTNSMGSWSWNGSTGGAPVWGSSTVGCGGSVTAFMTVCSTTPTSNVVDVVSSTTVKDFANLGVPVAANTRLLAIDQLYRSIAGSNSFSASVIDEQLNYFEQLEQLTAAATPITFTGTASSGSTSLTVSSATNLHYASVIQCAGVPANDFATAVSGTTVTLAYPTTAALSSTACSSPNQMAAEQQMYNVAGPHPNLTAVSTFEWNAIDKFVESFTKQDGQRAPAGLYPLQTYDAAATVNAPSLNYVVPGSAHFVSSGTSYTITLPALTSGKIEIYQQAFPYTSVMESRYFNTCNTFVHLGSASGTNMTASPSLFAITVPSGTDPGTGITFTPSQSGYAQYVLSSMSANSNCKTSSASILDAQPTVTVNGQPCPLGGACTIPASTAGLNTPAWLQFLGDGSDGQNINASGSLSGEHWYTNFTVPFGNTITASAPLVIHATGTCTIAGNITANGNYTGNGYGGGAGGGSGGGTAAGTAGSPSYPAPSSPSYTVNNVGGGAAGAAGGGTGGNGISPGGTIQKSLTASGGSDGAMFMGSAGKAGANSGGTAGGNGYGVTLICNVISGSDGTHTGTIDASGTAGGNAAANNTGAGSGGGGAPVILSSAGAVTTWPTVLVNGGAGGSCLSFTGCGPGGTGGNGWFAEFAGW